MGLKHQRRSAAWTILPEWTYRSRRRVSAFWMMSDIDIAVADSLKVLDLKRRNREADIGN